MAKYTVTRACGHEETVALIGKIKNREWRLEQVEPQKLCSECWQKEVEKKRTEETRLAAEEAKKSGLPALVGTEKQVAWAERIRIQLLCVIQEWIDRVSTEEGQRILAKYGKMTLEDIDVAMKEIQQQTSAPWWIDRRDFNIHDLVKMIQEKFKESQNKVQMPPDVEVEASIEVTVRPENPKTETVAEIRALDDAVEIEFPEKRDDFWEIVKKKLGMEWSGKCWRRSLKAKNGTPQDRAAEAGHRLLAAGFPIRIYDPEIRARAIAREYEPECTRWIQKRTTGEYTGWFAITWDREDDFYKAAKAIGGSRYSKPSVVVPPEKFEEILDFAKMYGFKLSDAAMEVAETAQRIKEATLTVKVDAPKEQPKVIVSGKPPRLEVPEEVVIADEFKD